MSSAVATGGGGPKVRNPPTAACAPNFGLFRVLFLSIRTRQQAIMEKNNKAQKYLNYSLLKFSRFFAKFLATNCCT